MPIAAPQPAPLPQHNQLAGLAALLIPLLAPYAAPPAFGNGNPLPANPLAGLLSNLPGLGESTPPPPPFSSLLPTQPSTVSLWPVMMLLEMVQG